MSAEVQESGNKKKGSKQKKMTVRVLYALYLFEQTSNDGDKHAE